MNVPSWQFLVFALVGAAVFNIPFGQRWRDAVWLVLNLAFVWSFSYAVGPLLPLAGFLVLGYLGLEAARTRRAWTAPVSIILVLAVFIWLKRYTFIPHALLLPPGYMAVGLSYIFFRVMHLVIDAGQGAEERISVLKYVNFTLNFPAFISGPIQRFEDYQANSALPLDLPDIGVAAWRMVLGAFKVLILSAALHAWQLDLLAALPERSDVLIGAGVVVLYPLFLYANFSGYVDFVIGIARLYRLRLPENFDQPFAATNFIDFWSRWHITLSQWLRSYVFNPLLMTWMRRYRSARTKQYPAVAAFFVTFFLVGAWHGQTSEFLFFGLLQGGGVAGNRLYQVAMTRRLTPSGYGRLCANPVYRAVARGLTFTWFAFTLLWFWADWQQIGALAERLGLAGSVAAVVGTVGAASIVLALPDALGGLSGRIGLVLRSRYTRTAFASAMILALTVAGLVLRLSSPEIVYKQF
ncbi:MBOAT family O-acyltransferase [Rhodopila sp.]|uniref:MBOAT family O-acyltransferase n=1 Tax=Rhodopila sp. TaxID=2480087 RepID=UPI003D11E769